MCADRLALAPIIDRCCRGDDGSDCFQEGRAYRVRLWGGLPDGWAGNLALHAFALRLEIVSGEAVCLAACRWAATFVVRPADSRVQLVRHNFLHMARRAPRAVPPLPAPEIAIAFREAPDGSSDVVARVTGKDAIGLLADVLQRFEALALRIREFSLRTMHEQVDDWFWLERRTPPER